MIGIPVGGTIYVLLWALRNDRCTFKEYVERLNALEAAGFHMSAGRYRKAREAGNRVVDR